MMFYYTLDVYGEGFAMYTIFFRRFGFFWFYDKPKQKYWHVVFMRTVLHQDRFFLEKREE